MKINRMAEEKNISDWAFTKDTSEYFNKEAINKEEVERLASLSDTISDDDLVLEKDRIELCASNNTIYHYNSNWSENVKSELKEYASACGMDISKFKAVEPTKISNYASSNAMIKTASVSSQIVLDDPFKINILGNTDHMNKSNWQNINKEAKLEDKPSMKSSVIPIRGGEDYFANSESKVAKGQNSITDPNAIGKLAESQKEDTGARLKRENKEKEESKKTRHAEWQNEKVAAMENKGILPNRSVFPTESLNAQPGIKGNIFDFESVPEKTDGEKLREANEKRKKNIMGSEKPKYDFTAEKAPTRSISEDFSSELKKQLLK